MHVSNALVASPKTLTDTERRWLALVFVTISFFFNRLNLCVLFFVHLHKSIIQFSLLSSSKANQNVRVLLLFFIFLFWMSFSLNG